MTPRPPLRLAYLISQYPAINHTFILREVRSLRECGAEITLMSVEQADRAPSALSLEEEEERARTFYIKPIGAHWVAAHLRTIATHPVGYLSGLFLALRLGAWKPRAVLAHLLYFAEAVVAGDHMARANVGHVHTHFSSTVALIAERVFPITMSVTFHGPAEFAEPTLFHLRQKVERSRFLCAISHYARSQLCLAAAPQHWGKISVARLGVDTARFGGRDTADQGVLRLLCVGRLAPVKAQTVLLEAIRQLRAEGRGVTLTIIGDGEDRPALEAFVHRHSLADSVVFMGSQLHEAVRTAYRTTDIFALASFAEGVPVVLMEAMAMEIPCVATSIAGIPELIEHGVSGLLVPPSDDAGFTRAIARLHDDPVLRRTMGAAGRARVLRDYDLSTNVMRLHEILANGLEGPGQGAAPGAWHAGQATAPR